MEDFEKLGVFYLGRPYSLKEGKAREGLLLYDSRDLLTHAVCIGMTGSGKTGLCITLLEEAALDGIPAIIIDPKGDLPNLLLTFPNLRPEDFRPWINEEDARRKGVTPEVFAQQQAELWSKGLADWRQSGERIQRLRESAEFVVYTPGSSAGIPVSILRSFAAPEPTLREDAELLQERVSSTVAGLLGLVGIQADPIQSREHILLSTLLAQAWRQGQDLDLAALIQQVQNPPVAKVGVLDLESFYPSKDRFGLVMALNNLLAAPGFSVWLEGEPLDIGAMLYTSTGKPRHCILSIAHLSDPERMFFVSLLLTQVLGWMRLQPGTNSLRAILYMDEVFGYLPPVANPPSKPPLLSLLKQARAFGLGLVLATQNPVDLDYKALSNAGTWFIGRLQTERDKARLLEGLEGAAASAAGGFDRGRMEQTMAALGNRIFLMHNVHEDAPEVFQTRWAMSYLRGPMTREQIKVLMGSQRPAASVPARRTVVAAAVGELSTTVPALPAEVPQVFLPRRVAGGEGTALLYRPMVLGMASVHYSDAKRKVEHTEEVAHLTSVSDGPIVLDWEASQSVTLSTKDLGRALEAGAFFAKLPAAAAQPKNYASWSTAFSTWLTRARSLELYRSPSTGELSQPGETERDFRVRLGMLARERRDAAVEKLRTKYAARINTLQERLRRAQQAVEREAEQARQMKMQTAISLGSTLLGAVVGRRAISAGTLGRATTAARGVSRSLKEQQDIGRAKESVEALEEQLKALEAEFEAEVAGLEQRIDPQSEAIETLVVRPKKADIVVKLVTLAWVPHWRTGEGAQAAESPAL